MQNLNSTIQILLARHGGKVLIPFVEASTTAGMAEQTARNSHSRGDYPMPTVEVGRRRFVHVQDLAEYIDSLRQPKQKRGARTKKARLEAKGWAS
jgi:hypothetical protein